VEDGIIVVVEVVLLVTGMVSGAEIIFTVGQVNQSYISSHILIFVF